MAKDPGALSVGATNSLTSPQRTTVCAPAALMPMATATTDRASAIRTTRFMLVRDAGPVPSWAPTDRTPANARSVAIVRAVKGPHDGRLRARRRSGDPLRGTGSGKIPPRRCEHVDHLSGLLEDACAVRGVRRNAEAVAGRQDPLLPGDHHGEGPLDHDAELLDVVLVGLDDRLRRVVVADERGVVGVDDTSLDAGLRVDERE